MVWRAEDPQGNEAGKVKYDIVEYTRGVVLDLGCGPNKAFPHFLGVDSCKDTELFGIGIRPDIKVGDCADLSATIEDASVDAVFSAHLLEHIEDTEAALKDWWRCIKVGGHLVLGDLGRVKAAQDAKSIIDQMRDIGGYDLIVREDDKDLLVFKKLESVSIKNSWMVGAFSHKKTACVVRYGGFGDMIQAANVLPALKREGYHVTVMTTPKGQDIVKADPTDDVSVYHKVIAAASGIPVLVPGQLITAEITEYLASLLRSQKRMELHGIVHEGYQPCVRVLTAAEEKRLRKLGSE